MKSTRRSAYAIGTGGNTSASPAHARDPRPEPVAWTRGFVIQQIIRCVRQLAGRSKSIGSERTEDENCSKGQSSGWRRRAHLARYIHMHLLCCQNEIVQNPPSISGPAGENGAITSLRRGETSKCNSNTHASRPRPSHCMRKCDSRLQATQLMRDA